MTDIALNAFDRERMEKPRVPAENLAAKVQLECDLRSLQVDLVAVRCGGRDAEPIDRDWPQKRRVDFSNLDLHALMTRRPFEPEAEAMGDDKRGEEGRGSRSHEQDQNENEKALAKRHRSGRPRLTTR